MKIGIVRPGFHVLDHEFASLLAKHHDVVLFIPSGAKKEYPFFSLDALSYEIREYAVIALMPGYGIPINLYKLLHVDTFDTINGSEDHLPITWITACYAKRHNIYFTYVAEKYISSRFRLFAKILAFCDYLGLTRYVWHVADAIIAHGSATKTYLLNRGCPEQKIHTLMSGYNARVFSYKKHLYTPGDPLKIVSVGRLIYHKGYTHLIRALARTSHAATLTIIGVGPEYANIKHLADSLGVSVVFLGSVPNTQLQQIFDAHDVYICSSVLEIASIAACEALGAGLPLICTDKGSTKDYTLDASCGWIYDPYDYTQVPKIIAAIATTDILQQKYRAVATYAKTFSWEGLLPKYQAVLFRNLM